MGAYTPLDGFMGYDDWKSSVTEMRLANGVFLDGKQFWPIYERAEELDVPIYFHPGLPDARVIVGASTTPPD